MATPINILIVDDLENLTVLEAILDNPGYRLVRAQSAQQALLASLIDEFALLILDIRMPDVTGIELAWMVKARKKYANVPIIFLTAFYNEDQHIIEGYTTGAVDSRKSGHCPFQSCDFCGTSRDFFARSAPSLLGTRSLGDHCNFHNPQHDSTQGCPRRGLVRCNA